MSSATAAPAVRLDGLDGIRAIAVTAVIMTHSTARLPGGQIGVDIFFALSGFLITSVLLREHSRFGSISLKSFYARRFLRLVPALVVFLPVATVIALAYKDKNAWLDLLVSATYTTNLYFATQEIRPSFTGHTWSLAIEEQFYLIWPITLILLLRLRTATMVWIVAAALVAFIALTWLFQSLGAPIFTLYELPTTRVPELLVGALGAIGWHYGLPARLVAVLRSPLVAAAALAALFKWMFHVTWTDPWSFRGGFVVVGALTVVVVLHVILRPDSLVNRVLSLPPAVWVGRRSYAMYLWHIPLLAIAAEFVTGEKKLFLLTFVAAAIVADLSWRLVEGPALRYKHRFERVHLVAAEPAPVPGPA